VGKSGLKNILGIGRWVVGIQMIFVDRTASKEELKKAAMAIEQRQIDVEEGKYPRFLINGQGMQTNEAYITPLKRGPFSGLKPVEMWYQRPNSSSVHPAFECLPLNILLILVFSNLYNNIEVLMFP